MDKAQVLELVRRFAEKARQALDVRQVILFGSHARGCASAHSDIDVAVVIGVPPDDWLDASAQLFKLRRDISLAIEPVLVDPAADRSGFFEEICKTGEFVYDREAA